MRWSKYFIPTSKEVPADAHAPSHQLMIRAGLIKQLVAGAYIYLPLGYRTLRKISAIVREEMNRAGAIELHMPAMHPIELWAETGRVQAMGGTLIRLVDQDWRTGTVLGPTHEEVITHIVRSFVNSYKQLPLNLYQIQTKFRDERRPKSGVLRTREFLMKDAYSFDTDMEGLGRSYDRMYAAYCRIYERSGLPYVAVEADSGAIGGDVSHEFMVLTEAGEDLLVTTPNGSYAANVERASVAPLAKTDAGALQPLEEVHTPGLGSVEQVSRFVGCAPSDMIKTIIFDTDQGPLVALVRGDHEINEAKLRKTAGVARVEAATPDVIEEVTGAAVGFAGPVGLDARTIADQAVTLMHNAVTGANKTDYHYKGVNPDRDFKIKEAGDIRMAVEGDRGPDGQKLIFKKCIEVGHVFKLGTKYSAAMKATFLDEQGQSKPCVMGCYGIGINRIMAAVIEAHHDEAGIIWPATIAPFEVVICALDTRDQHVVETAEQLYRDLTAAGVEVLLDDREVRPGPKFKDADLIGIPLRITVGKKSLQDNVVELKRRDSDEVQRLSPQQVVDEVGRQLHLAMNTNEA